MRRIGTIAITLLACLFAAGCQAQLYGSLQEKEANAVIAALQEASIPAEKRPGEEGTYAVFVDEQDIAKAMRVLESLALPRRHYDDLGTVFGKGAMFSTPLEEKARYLYAMQEDLSKTIAAIDGVLEARVHLVLPELDQLGRSIQTPSAAVFVKHVDDERHDPVNHRIEIRKLVAAGVPNLDQERIVVTFFPARPQEEAAIEPAFRTVLGLRVADESAVRVWWGAGAAGAAVLVLVVLCVFLVARKGRK